MLGREVNVLFEGTQPAGTYAVQFDAGDLASGLYMYRLEGEKSVVTKSMMLLK
jgi:hypothetical protein